MFSGIKSIFFGYYEPEGPPNATESHPQTAGQPTAEPLLLAEEGSSLSSDEAPTNSAKRKEKSSSFGQDTTAFLNKATTKFTEQLLPQSPSIEQLQLSSHQLLPTLNEQHQNDANIKENSAPKAHNDDCEDDDDGCLDVDSWEMLDLVRKQSETVEKQQIAELVVVAPEEAKQGQLCPQQQSSPEQPQRGAPQQAPLVTTYATKSCPSMMLPPPPPPMPPTTMPTATSSTGSSANGNDSSDVAEMDESWYVTPPPCFTGGNKVDTKIIKPKEKEAARENALIEHPSIYIASTSKQYQQQQPQQQQLPFKKRMQPKQQQDSSHGKNNSLKENSTMQKTIVLKKVVKQPADPPVQVESAKSSNTWKTKKSSKPAASEPELQKLKNTKAWENKFKVSCWGLDEQDDIDDFDNLFEAEETAVVPQPKTKKPHKAKKRQKQRENIDFELTSSPELADGNESDFSFTSPALVETFSNNSVSLDSSNEPNKLELYSGIESQNVAMPNPVSEKDSISDEAAAIYGQENQLNVQPVEYSLLAPQLKKSWHGEVSKERRFDIISNMKEQIIYRAESGEDSYVNSLIGFLVKLEGQLFQLSNNSEEYFSSARVKLNELLEGAPLDSILHELPMENTLILESKRNLIEAITGEDVMQKVSRAPEKKALTQVSPIGPERCPGWQLKRKRSRRRPLGASTALMNGAVGVGAGNKLKAPLTANDQLNLSSGVDGSAAGSNSSSARSTPTLIDRIGSSIVANLTNLTNGFSSTTIPSARASGLEEVERLNQSVVRKTNAEANLVSRRRLSKAYLNRHNDCTRMGNSNRRADRRLKMHTTPNGYSINRKVHTSFH